MLLLLIRCQESLLWCIKWFLKRVKLFVLLRVEVLLDGSSVASLTKEGGRGALRFSLLPCVVLLLRVDVDAVLD